MKDRVRQTRRWGSVKKTLLSAAKLAGKTAPSKEADAAEGLPPISSPQGEVPSQSTTKPTVEPSSLDGNTGNAGTGPDPSAKTGKGGGAHPHVRIGNAESVELRT